MTPALIAAKAARKAGQVVFPKYQNVIVVEMAHRLCPTHPASRAVPDHCLKNAFCHSSSWLVCAGQSLQAHSGDNAPPTRPCLQNDTMKAPKQERKEGSMTGQFIDFKAVRERLDADQIVTHYEIKVARRNGSQLSVHSPFSNDERPSMGINTQKQVFKCHSTGNGGNLLDLVCLLEGHDPRTKEGIRAGALCAQTHFLNGEDLSARQEETKTPPHQKSEANEEGAQPEPQTDKPVQNKPLSFALKLEPSHPMMTRRGFKPETYDAFGVGFCKRGLMKGRICFPLRDANDELIGYAGRWAEEEPPKDIPRYLLPKDLNKSELLYGWSKISEAAPHTVCIVEGFWSCLRLWEAGIPAVGALGHEVHERQAELLKAGGVKRAIIMFDGDAPGRAGATNASGVLAQHMFVRNIVLRDGMKPDTMPDGMIIQLPKRT